MSEIQGTNQVELFKAYSVEEVHDRRELFGYYFYSDQFDLSDLFSGTGSSD